MKLPQPNQDFTNALRFLGKGLPETDEEIDAFIKAVESGEITVPETPEHLTPTAIAAAAMEGKLSTPPPTSGGIVQFSNAARSAFPVAMAARNGETPLSEESLRKMREAQDD